MLKYYKSSKSYQTGGKIWCVHEACKSFGRHQFHSYRTLMFECGQELLQIGEVLTQTWGRGEQRRVPRIGKALFHAKAVRTKVSKSPIATRPHKQANGLSLITKLLSIEVLRCQIIEGLDMKPHDGSRRYFQDAVE